MRGECQAEHPTDAVRCNLPAGHLGGHRYMSWNAQDVLQWDVTDHERLLQKIKDYAGS